MNVISNNNKERESNFELLRIIVMIGIILFHYSDHGCNDISYDNALAINNAFECFCRIGGGLGNCVFMILTGYFMSKSQFKIKKVVKIWSQVFFYSVLSYVVACSLEITYLSKKDLLEVLMPITSNQYWYFTAYIVIFFASPIINSAFEKMEKTQIIIVLLSLIWFFSIMPTLGYVSTTSNDRLGVMVLLYFIGAYIRKYYSEKTKKGLIIESISMVVLLTALSGFSIYWEKITEMQLFTSSRFDLIWGIEKTPIIIFSILFFLIFKNLSIEYNKVINWIAASVFGVYLLHMNNWTTYIIWNNICRTRDYYESPKMIGHVLLCTLLIYFVCTAIDKMRIYLIEKPLEKAIENKDLRKSKIVIAVVCVVIILCGCYVNTLRLITPYSSSLEYNNNSVSIITMDEGIEIAEEFYNSVDLEIRKIVFHTITWNSTFIDDQVLEVSILDASKNIVYSQKIPMNQFSDQGDYELKLTHGIKLRGNEQYSLKFSSNTLMGQQTIALMLTEISNNCDGKCTVNDKDILGHISAVVSGFKK